MPFSTGLRSAAGPYPGALSSLAAASRYSPYSKPGLLPTSLPGLVAPPPPPSLAPSLASLTAAPGYPASLYALYGARL